MKLPIAGDIIAERYRIDRVLGQSSSARLYAATTLGLDRRVALKVLEPDGDAYEPTRRASFQREVATLARLRDPHTLEIFDVGETADGVVYFVSELVEGSTLAELLASRGPLPEDDVIHIARQMLSSLAEAHDHGIVHRNLSPSNVRVFEYLGDPLRVKVLDFGITAFLDESVDSARYLAPERRQGAAPTAASDVYGAGRMLFELARGPHAEPDSRTRGSEHTHFERVLQRMLAPAPASRFQHAGAALAAIDAPDALAMLPDLDAYEPAPPYPPASSPNIGFVVALVAAVALTVGAVLIGLDATRPIPEDAPALQTAPPIAELPPQPAEPVSAPAPPSPGLESDSVEADAGPSGPCDGDRPFTGAGAVTVERHLRQESVPVWLPPAYDGIKALPLVLYFTDAASPINAVRAMRLNRVADDEGFAVAAVHDPDGEFAATLVARTVEILREELCIDGARVFAAGAGNSGQRLHVMRCELPVAAIATIGQRDVSTQCKQGEGPSQLHFALREDAELPLGGGEACNGRVVEALERFEAHAAAEQDCQLREGDAPFAPDADCVVGECGTGRFASCRVAGGGGWLRPAPFDGCKPPAGGQYAFADAIWKFFATVPVAPR